MPRAFLEKYRSLTEQIDEIFFANLSDLMDDCFKKGSSSQRKTDSLEWNISEKVTSLSLQSLRLLVNAELLARGIDQYAELFRTDFNALMSNATWFFIRNDEDPVQVSDVVDLILLTAEGSRQNLLTQLHRMLGVEVGPPSTKTDTLFLIALEMVSFYLEKNMRQEAIDTALGLVALSERRCRTRWDLHRPLVARCLLRLVDAEQTCALQICESQAHYFDHVVDIISETFYWFYASMCHAHGKQEKSLELCLLCHRIACQVEGEQSLIGTRAMLLYHNALLPTDRSGTSEAYLMDFLKKAEADYYADTTGTIAIECALTQYLLLERNMERMTLRNHFDILQNFLDFCEKNSTTVRDPRLTLRNAANLLTAYYMEIGEFLLAEETMHSAMNMQPPEGLEKYPCDDTILSNLLYIYLYTNNVELMLRTARILEKKLKNGTLPKYLQERCIGLIQSAYAQLGQDTEDIAQEGRKTVRRLSNIIQQGGAPQTDTRKMDYAYGIILKISAFLDTFPSTQEDLRCCETVLLYFSEHAKDWELPEPRLVLLNMELARVNWLMGNKKALVPLKKSLAYGRSLQEFNPTRLGTLRIAAVIFESFGDRKSAWAIAEEALAYITAAWHNVVAYINDHRVCTILEIAQDNYKVFHALLRTEKSVEYMYGLLLRYKDLPSLVGRERNRQLWNARVDQKMLNKVYLLQDQLADAQAADMIHGTNHSFPIHQKLRQAENEFAQAFPKNICYTELSLQKLGEKLKEDEALIEYYFSMSWTGEAATVNDFVIELDIFVLTKRKGKLHLAYEAMPDGEGILDAAVTFIDIMQNGQDSQWADMKESLREDLYHALFDFALPQCTHAKTLYIAPDMDLCNLPFEILYADGEKELQKRFQICRIVCGRDLLFFEDTNTGRGTPFILGDPDYEAARGSTQKDGTRYAGQAFEAMESLPFSGVEARRIANRCRAHPYVGEFATKYALKNALPCRIIHLATHGMFDESMESDSLYSSCLLFAGYNRWLATKQQSEFCGNGILTADEISRMDLRDTELVVLSACNSGMGNYSRQSVKGLLSAFSVAGVRWVVSHIWKANDFTTPILMDAFYLAYLNYGMEVPKALQYAKNYLRTVSIGELRAAGWLNPTMEHLLPRDIQADLRKLRQVHDSRTPFQDESYWGGFVCYKCK